MKTCLPNFPGFYCSILNDAIDSDIAYFDEDGIREVEKVDREARISGVAEEARISGVAEEARISGVSDEAGVTFGETAPLIHGVAEEAGFEYLKLEQKVPIFD